MRAAGSLLLAGFLLSGCATAVFDPVKDPVKRTVYWGASPEASPLEEKLKPVPTEVLAFMLKDNVRQGFSEKPVAAHASAEFVADVRGALASLPAGVKEKISSRLYGLYLVNDLGGTAYTDAVNSDETHLPAGAFMLLDAAVLERKANEWGSWKENSAFKPEAGWSISLKLEKPDSDTRRQAIQYILLHEAGHVLSLAGTVHPRWDVELTGGNTPESFPFSKLSWKSGLDRRFAVALSDGEFAERKTVIYYTGDINKKPLLSSAPAIYSKLEKTSFVSLYGATNMGDDFAEAFASYVHVVMMHKPWRLEILHDGTLVKAFGACWAQSRCKAKRAFLEGFLGLDSPKKP